MNIILIEDDPRIADFLQRGLKAEGLQVQRAATGPEGLALVQDAARQTAPGDAPTVVVLDLMLPGMNGLEICQTLRAQGVPFPILMLTALSALEDRVAGLRMGADDYLCKPFEFEELLARLEALCRRAQGMATRPSHLQVADIVLDRDSMRATRAGEVLNLTARELALLELLMSAPGRLFSRERILSSVWGLNEDPLTNVVDVYIRRLRSKIDEGRDSPLIQTMRGLGYRLEAQAQRECIGRVLVGREHAVARAARAAVDAVRAGVGDQLVLVTVEREAGLGDAPGVASDEGAHGRRALEQVVQAVVAQRHITRHTVAVGHHDLQDPGAQVANGHSHAALVVQQKERRGSAIELALKTGRFEQAGERFGVHDSSEAVQSVQVTGAGLNNTRALCSFQCSAQVFLRPLATSSIR